MVLSFGKGFRMEEEGVVIQAGENMARVRIKRSQACGACQACARGDSDSMETWALNSCGAEVGDRIWLKISSGELLRGSFVVYILPLLAMLLGLAIGNGLAFFLGLQSKVEQISALTGILFLGLSLFAIYRYGKRIKGSSRFRPQITRILT